MPYNPFGDEGDFEEGRLKPHLEQKERWDKRWETIKSWFEAIKGPDKPPKAKKTPGFGEKSYETPESDQEKLEVMDSYFEGTYGKSITEGNAGELTEFFKTHKHFERWIDSIDNDSFLEMNEPLGAEQPVTKLEVNEKVDKSWKLIAKTDDLKLLPDDKKTLGYELLKNGETAYWNPATQGFVIQGKEEEEDMDSRENREKIAFGILE